MRVIFTFLFYYGHFLIDGRDSTTGVSNYDAANLLVKSSRLVPFSA